MAIAGGDHASDEGGSDGAHAGGQDPEAAGGGSNVHRFVHSQKGR
ncbi:unannotated protein [freshwater metagenome]|uniref:Unannotated protein n=1 Tax=freshwater metagenome TaxID=449393 RepID=A0A6J6QT81_9ZZZZ